MQSYHGSLQWRHAYAIGLNHIAQRYLELGGLKKTIRFYKKACLWSPLIILKITKNLFGLLFRKQRQTLPHWDSTENINS